MVRIKRPRPPSCICKFSKIILNKIKTGFYPPGSQMPTELEMEKIYGVSRAPIKQALGKLENAALITRHAGKGTFVSKWEAEKNPLQSMGGFGSQYFINWDNIRCQTLLVNTILADEKIAKALHVKTNSPVIYISRLRHAKNEAIFYLNHFIPAIIDVDEIKACGDFMSLPDLLQNKFGMEHYYVSEEISIDTAGPVVARMLEMKENDSVMFVKRFSYNANYEPVAYSEYYVKPGTWTYKVTYQRNLKNMPSKG